MNEKILGILRRNNKKRGMNVTIAMVIGYLLTGGIVYSQEKIISKKVVYDEEIKWLWPFEKGSSGKRLDGNAGGEVSPPEPEIIPPKKDEIPWWHDPDGINEDGVEQDSLDIYTGILNREWNKEKHKWEVVGLQDENGDGIADIYDPDGDFDGDGIENKYDENWASNIRESNPLFETSNGLGYVDLGQLLNILRNNENKDEIKNTLYHKNKSNYEEGMNKLNNTLKISQIEKYNETYNKENIVDNSYINKTKFEEKLKKLGELHLKNYNSYTTTVDGENRYILYNDNIIKTSQTLNSSKEKLIIVNKGKIETNNYVGQTIVKGKDFEAYNYGEIDVKAGDNESTYMNGQLGSALLKNRLYNYGDIKVDGGKKINYEVIGQGIRISEGDISLDNRVINYGYITSVAGGNAQVISGQGILGNPGMLTNGEIYNYGVINTESKVTQGYGFSKMYGQKANGAKNTKVPDLRYSLYNYGDIKLRYSNKSNIIITMRGQDVSGMEGHTASKIYNYGNIDIERSSPGNDRTNLEGQSATLDNRGTNSDQYKGYGEIYNYGNINIASTGNTESIGQRSEIRVGNNIERHNVYNYGLINIVSNGSIHGQAIQGIGENKVPSLVYNYGIISLSGQNTKGQTGKGEKAAIHNYGQIRVKGETYDTAGMEVRNGGKGFNYGIIEVDNKGLESINMGTGMWADGNNSEAFNYGSIIVTGLTGVVVNGIDTAYMRATGGGKVYNYGWLELKDSLDTLTIGEGVSSSTRTGYRSVGDFELKGEMKIMAETGKGNVYSKENFITAGGNGKEGNILGLENLTASGVYEISTIERKGDNGENIVDLVMNKTKNIEDLEKNSNTGRMVKELKLDNAVYGKDSEFVKNNKEFSEMISRKVSEGESLENLLGLEYANLNGQIIESGKVLLENQEKVASTDRTYLSGQFNKENNFDAVIINPQNETKIGIFHLNSDKDLGSHALGTYKYDLESTTIILQNNKNYMVGMNYSKLDYKNRNSDLRKTSVFLGHNYIRPLNDGISEYRNYINGMLTYNTMDRDKKRDDFKSYNINMTNEYVRKLDIKGLTYSEFTAGLKTTVFGHEKIKEHGADLTLDRNIEVKKKLGISNEINLGLFLNKSYEIGKNKENNNFGISTYLGYRKELMSVANWRDEFTIGTGSYAKYNKPVKEHDLGVGLGVVSARYEVKEGLTGTLSFSADTLGDTMVTFKMEYKF